MEKAELPRSAERQVEVFGDFFWKEVSYVYQAMSVDESEAFARTKDFFVGLWESSNSFQEWESRTNSFSKDSLEISNADKELLWEEIYFEITEPMALAFRLKKAQFAKSMATFGKMSAAVGFLAGIAYSLYMYGVSF